MKLFKWSGAGDIILFAFSADDSWNTKVIWGDKVSGEWNTGKLSENNFKLYDHIETIKLPPIVYRSLIEFIWSKKFSNFLKKDLK